MYSLLACLPTGIREFSCALSISQLDFSHLGVLLTATVRPSTKALETFCRLLPNTDTQKVALVKGTCSRWKARALRKVG